MMSKIEGLIQTLYNYFSKIPNMHLEFTKLVKLMEFKGAKILRNAKAQQISMLPFVRCVMVEHRILLMKMAIDGPTNDKEKANFDLFMMCKFYWGLLPFSHCYNQSTT
jgi:hypothetical protein